MPADDTRTATTDKSLRMSYRIGRGEQGVLSFEPYKSRLLPLWRFKTPAIARKSSGDLWKRFIEYHEQGDFVGMDMTRKFIQMVDAPLSSAAPTGLQQLTSLLSRG
jgi:hypothetical protein